MAERKADGGLRGQFNDRGQFRDGAGRQVKVDTRRNEVLKVRASDRRFKRVRLIKQKSARKKFDVR